MYDGRRVLWRSRDSRRFPVDSVFLVVSVTLEFFYLMYKIFVELSWSWMVLSLIGDRRPVFLRKSLVCPPFFC